MNDLDWEAIQREIDTATDKPKIDQLENITIMKILEMLPKGETWLVCLGLFRVEWAGKENFRSWWSPNVMWQIVKVEDNG